MRGVFIDDGRLLVLEHPPAVSPCDLFLRLRLASLSASSIAHTLQARCRPDGCTAEAHGVRWSAARHTATGRLMPACSARMTGSRPLTVSGVRWPYLGRQGALT